MNRSLCVKEEEEKAKRGVWGGDGDRGGVGWKAVPEFLSRRHGEFIEFLHSPVQVALMKRQPVRRTLASRLVPGGRAGRGQRPKEAEAMKDPPAGFPCAREKRLRASFGEAKLDQAPAGFHVSAPSCDRASLATNRVFVQT